MARDAVVKARPDTPTGQSSICSFVLTCRLCRNNSDVRTQRFHNCGNPAKHAAA